MSLLKKIHNAVIPSKTNSHHPHFFRHSVIVPILVLVLVLEFGALLQSIVFFRSGSMMASVLPGAVSSLTNVARESNGLFPLTIDKMLTRAAQEKANDMSIKGYFSHVSPDGTLPWQWIRSVGYDYQYAGENLAVNFTDSNDLVNAWMASPEHRNNILKTNYTEIGIGMATGTYQGREAVFVVQYLASPLKLNTIKSESVPIKVSPKIVDAIYSPVEKSLSIAESSSTSSVVPAVLGESTQKPIQAKIRKARLVDYFISSPRTLTNSVIMILLAIFSALFVLGAIFSPKIKRSNPRVFTFWHKIIFNFYSRHHPSATVNMLALFVVLLGVLLINKGYVIDAPVHLSLDTHNSSISQQL